MVDMALRFDGPAQDQTFVTASARSLSRHFSRLEQTVIALGRSDSAATLGSTWLARLVQRLFGVHPAGRLADSKLEALRRMSLLLQLRPDDIEPEEVESFLSFFSWDQLVALSGGSGLPQ